MSEGVEEFANEACSCNVSLPLRGNIHTWHVAPSRTVSRAKRTCQERSPGSGCWGQLEHKADMYLTHFNALGFHDLHWSSMFVSRGTSSTKIRNHFLIDASLLQWNHWHQILKHQRLNPCGKHLLFWCDSPSYECLLVESSLSFWLVLTLTISGL